MMNGFSNRTQSNNIPMLRICHTTFHLFCVYYTSPYLHLLVRIRWICKNKVYINKAYLLIFVKV